ncbi:MAG: response regulator, partial [Solirubrobacteraceae bacterium]
MQAQARIRVLVVDDHELLRRGLVPLLEQRGIHVVGELGSGAEAVAAAALHEPDVVLMDLTVPGLPGIEATRRLTAATPASRVVVFTVVDDDYHVREALLAGACGYLLKDAPVDQILEGIQAAARGEVLLSPRAGARFVAQLRAPHPRRDPLPTPDLSDRLLEVLDLVARGIDNQEIANTLFLSEHTVKNHVSTILEKLQVHNRVQAAVRGVQAGLVSCRTVGALEAATGGLNKRSQRVDHR